ncbi:MAG: RNB domain-containing ribonuclease, partial [Nitrospira sp.]
AVAGRLMGIQRPTIYRVHEEPDDLRLNEYREEVLSHNVPCGNLSKRVEVQKLLHRLGTLPIGPALKIGFLKSLMRARYAVEPLGHYGLAKKKYAHFTSPIRRYADLVVHRSLFDQKPGSFGALSQIGEHISMTERNSADAERDSKDVKLFAFLKAQLKSGRPERYAALVTGVRNFGFFVDVPGLVMSGLVPLSTVEDDFYIFEPDRNHLIGRRSRRIIRLGDNVTVQVAKVDTAKKQVDFRLAPEPGQQQRSPQRPQHQPQHRRTGGAQQRQSSEGQPQRPPLRQSERPVLRSSMQGGGRPKRHGQPRRHPSTAPATEPRGKKHWRR